MKKLFTLVLLALTNLSAFGQMYSQAKIESLITSDSLLKKVTSFYDTSTKKDLHYQMGWNRSRSSITLVNSELKIAGVPNLDSAYVETNFIYLNANDILNIEHRISNSSGSAYLRIAYIDSVSNIIYTAPIIYSNASVTTNSTVPSTGKFKIRLYFVKNSNSNNSGQYFNVSKFKLTRLIPLAVKENTKKQINNIIPNVGIYPVPVTDETIIIYNNIDGDEKITVKVTSINGQLIYSENYNVNDNFNTLEFKNELLTSGLYIIQIWSNNELKKQSTINK